jgi:hypothetical protein
VPGGTVYDRAVVFTVKQRDALRDRVLTLAAMRAPLNEGREANLPGVDTVAPRLAGLP